MISTFDNFVNEMKSPKFTEVELYYENGTLYQTRLYPAKGKYLKELIQNDLDHNLPNGMSLVKAIYTDKGKTVIINKH